MNFHNDSMTASLRNPHVNVVNNLGVIIFPRIMRIGQEYHHKHLLSQVMLNSVGLARQITASCQEERLPKSIWHELSV